MNLKALLKPIFITVLLSKTIEAGLTPQQCPEENQSEEESWQWHIHSGIRGQNLSQGLSRALNWKFPFRRGQKLKNLPGGLAIPFPLQLYLFCGYWDPVETMDTLQPKALKQEKYWPNTEWRSGEFDKINPTQLSTYMGERACGWQTFNLKYITLQKKILC